MKLILTTLALGLAAGAALAQRHHHPPQDAAIHERFYSDWMMPDNPSRSCCNKADCYPTEIEMRDGQLYALRREDGAWLKVPPAKIEQVRGSPDGRNHVCAPPPSHGAGDIVFCFVFGGGV